LKKRVAIPLLALSLMTAGCLFKKKAPAPPPAPVPAQQRPPLEVPPVKAEPPPPLEAPKLDLPAPTPQPPEPTVIRPKLERAEPPKPAARKPRSRRTQPARAVKPKESPAPAESSPATTEATPAAPTPLPQPLAPPPKLGEVLPDEKRRESMASIEADLSSAQKVLREIEGKGLSREQSESADRIRNFIQQASQAKSDDITGAVQLARRAAILAAELSRSIN